MSNFAYHRRQCAVRVIGLACALFASSLTAQEVTPTPQPEAALIPLPAEVLPSQPSGLQLADLEGLALQYNPTLAQAVAAIDQERGVWRQAGLYPNPQMGYLRSDPSGAGGTRSEGVFVSQEIVTKGKLRLGRAVEAQEIRRLEAELVAQKLRVLNDLKIRYFEVLGAQQGVVIAEDLVHLASEGLRLADQLLKAQGATRADVLQARIQEQGAKAALDEAKVRYDAAWRQMTAMIGLPHMAPNHLVGRLDEPSPPLDFEASYAALTSASPQLQAALIRIQHAQQEVLRERAAVCPNVTVQTVTEFDHTNGSTTVSTLLAAPVPVFNRNQGNIYHAYADIREARAEVERVRLVLHDQLAEAFRRRESARVRVERLQQSILPDADENLKLVSEGQRQGEFSLFQVLSARQLYAQSHMTYAEALTELQKVTIEIDGFLLTGGLNPAALGAAIQTQSGMKQPGLLNQLQESSTKQLLPGAIQAIGP